MPIATAWKTDNYKFVGKAFESAYANRLNKLRMILGEVNAKNVDYELQGAGGYGEMMEYDGDNLNQVQQKRAFNTIIRPKEYTSTVIIHRKQALIDKSGECRKTGVRLGDSAAMTVYLHCLRMFGGAFDPTKLGGDGLPWASTKHWMASKGSNGRVFVPDPDAGTYSNLINLGLTVENILKAQVMGNKMMTPDGLPMAANFNLLLVSPENEGAAKKICGDGAKIRPERNPDDDTNAANPVYDLHYMVVGGGKDGFTGKQWALCDPTLMKEICKIVYTSRPQVLNHELDNPLKDAYTGYVDFGVGWGDARQIIFSDPT